MKILYVYEALARWGGIERVLVDKMNALVRLYGYDVYILTADQGPHQIPFPLDERVHYEDMGIRFHLQYRLFGIRKWIDKIYRHYLFETRLKKKIQEISPDVIVGTSRVFVNTLTRQKGRRPLVIESHSIFSKTYEYADQAWFRQIQERFYMHSIGKADVLISLTEGDAKDWRKINRRVEIIPNVVHLNTSGHYSDCSAHRVIFAGRFAEQKGIPDLLRVWKKVYERHPDWQLDLYGEGELKDQLQAEIAQMGMIINVYNPTKDILDQFIGSSIFVLPSVYEPFGLVLVEAMSCGLPVVSFDCPYGPADIITHGVDGFLVRDRNIQEFADRICQLIESQTLRQQMGQAAVLSSRRYSAEKIMPMWKDLFDSLVGTNQVNEKLEI